MTPNLALLEGIDRATAFCFEEMTRRTPGGRVVHREGLLLAIGADPSPVLVNTIPGAVRTQVDGGYPWTR